MKIKEAAEKYIYADYAKWNDDKRRELIDGAIYMMSPGPSRMHQKISGELYGQLWTFLQGKSCEVYSAPFDVRLNAAGDDDDTVVQPDIAVICDKSKLDDKGCNGAPDMIVEVVSPSSTSHDMLIKLNKYLKAGVREYWIVDPKEKTVFTNVLENGQYIIREFKEKDIVPVHVLDGCEINLQEVFIG